MTDGLRIMIYDSADREGWTKQLKEYTSDDLDDLIDELDINIGLSHSWIAGGWMFKQLGRFDYTKGFSSWSDALEWLCTIDPDQKIAEIQYWGHGSPGKVWMNGRSLHSKSFESYTNGPLLERLKKRLSKDSLVWFRCCSVFLGQRGQAFAKVWADNLGCEIAAHTYIIHLFQSGLHCIRPGEVPEWPLREGIVSGTASVPKEARWSAPWSLRTIFALRSRLPKWAYKG